MPLGTMPTADHSHDAPAAAGKVGNAATREAVPSAADDCGGNSTGAGTARDRTRPPAPPPPRVLPFLLTTTDADADGFPPRAALSASAEVAAPVAALEALFAASRGVGSSSQRASDDVVGMIFIIVGGGGGLTNRWRVSIALKLLLLMIVMLVSSLHLQKAAGHRGRLPLIASSAANAPSFRQGRGAGAAAASQGVGASSQ